VIQQDTGRKAVSIDDEASQYHNVEDNQLQLAEKGLFSEPRFYSVASVSTKVGFQLQKLFV